MKAQKSINLESLSELTVLDGSGILHGLCSFWSEKPALFVFVRQFG